jgi:hypothetical protein
LPALIAQAFALALVVPHFPLPIVPVMTVNDVTGSVPFELTVTGVAEATSQPV